MNLPRWRLLVVAVCFAPFGWHVSAASPKTSSLPGDQLLAATFANETAALAQHCLSDVQTAADWERLRPVLRRQLFEMLGLDPLPARGDLRATITGVTERDEIVVEKLHFQSSPALYATANLYRPRHLTGPVPAILYLCGHGPVISNGVSYGNKVAYQHHGIWFARNGYICLTLDTLQLGEIQGLHHGTYREGMWWWNSRGYTPAGVEAWNSIRALDYLQTRPEVDTNRIGVTGRSGGGAYSWWIAALDDRIRAAAPVAGITDLQNHVVDGTVEGHCDCMFMVNTYRWDYPQVAALVAPRPLLIVNTDADSIFPLDGVVRTHRQVRRIYELLHAPQQLGLVIGPGPHKDTQDLQVPVFRWFNRHLKQNEPLIEMAAVKLFRPEELKVFGSLPPDALNPHIEETFVPAAATTMKPLDRSSWPSQRELWRAQPLSKVFGGWPEKPCPLQVTLTSAVTRAGLRLEMMDFWTQERLPLRLYIIQPADLTKPTGVQVEIMEGEKDSGAASMAHWLATWRVGFGSELAGELTVPGMDAAEDRAGFAVISKEILGGRHVRAWIAPRGVGLTAWSGDSQAQAHLRRRFVLLGQTLAGMRVWDVRRALQALRTRPGLEQIPITLRGAGAEACTALHAALFEPGIEQLELRNLPESYQNAPDYLNVMRVLDLPQTLVLALDRGPVRVIGARVESWDYAAMAVREMDWKMDRLKFER